MSKINLAEKKYHWNKVNIREILPLIIDKIQKVALPEKIILVGSYAYGTETPDSDLDFIIIKKNFTSRKIEIMKIRQSLRNFIIPKDIIVVKTSDYDYYSKNWKNSIFAEAHKNGIIMYERI